MKAFTAKVYRKGYGEFDILGESFISVMRRLGQFTTKEALMRRKILDLKAKQKFCHEINTT